ncbi:MAG TPA: ComF family protein [Tepidisphaeraceae bacterium]|nr:ComF family protein [Tepidisphaeraceae bacterium]
MQLAAPWRHLIDFCYPPICAACNESNPIALPLCPKCANQLSTLAQAPACISCGMPVAERDAPCPRCLGEGMRPLERIARLTVFDEPVRHLIHQIKYHGKWTLAEFLANRLNQQRSVERILREADLLVPVPLHPWRHFSRGFNQAELIARRLGKLSRVKVASPLIRLKNTHTQTFTRAKDQRFDNLRDAFGLLRPKQVRDKHVVLIDDVMTTGATLTSAARCIFQAEPASVCAIVVAVADWRRRDFKAV